MSTYFHHFNIFSQFPTFRVSGNSKAYSFFGSLVGLISIVTLISGISFILIDYFTKLAYSINSYTNNLEIPNIVLKDLKFGFRILNQVGQEFELDVNRLFKISAIYWDVHIPVKGDNTTSIQVKPTQIPIIKCDQYTKGSIFYEEFASYAKNFRYIDCLDLESIGKNITGAYGNLGT